MGRCTESALAAPSSEDLTGELMKSIINNIQERFVKAAGEAFGPDVGDIDPLIRPSQDTKFGDYQSNVAMGLAKKLKSKPRQIAEKIITHLDIDEMCFPPEIAGPGFINLRLRHDWLSGQLQQILSDARLGIDRAPDVEKVVVDFSGPNIAKQMHVGHLRSTILGDVISRVLAFLGHDVIRQNHIGDWGTQFGMLIEFLFDTFGDNAVKEGKFHIADMEDFYKQAQARFSSDAEFAQRARQRVVDLQAGTPEALQAWKVFRNESLRHCQDIYDRLGVQLTPDDVRGESFYNEMLPDVVDELLNRQKLAVKDQGAVCIFLDEFKARDGSPLPVIIQKSDGGYLYATTDRVSRPVRGKRSSIRSSQQKNRVPDSGWRLQKSFLRIYPAVLN